MTRRHGWLALVFALTLAIPANLLAQSGAARRRAVDPTAGDEITLLQTTDIHDHGNGSGHVGLDVDPVNGTSTVGAYARIAAYIDWVRSTATHPVVLVDSGDWTMGTLYDLTIGSQPIALYFLQAMRYDCTTLGNHEFDYTPKGLAGMIAAAQKSFGFSVPIVASNMSLNGNTDLAPLFGAGKAIQPTYIETLSNGLKIGYIGLMGEDAATDAPASAPVSFAPLSSNYAMIQSLVDGLRSQGANIVIALSHSGTDATGTSGEDVNLARHVHGINVIASGHTHTPLSAAHAVTNGSWTTQIIDAGAFGTNVFRIDLRIDRAAGTTTPREFSNAAMTDASLASMPVPLHSDAATGAVVHATDLQLNSTLSPLMTQFFSDYSTTNLGKGIYHAVGMAAQDMAPNDKNAVLCPNGLGDLAADAVRNVPNAIIAKTLAAAGGNPANVPGFDFTPFQVGVVPTGVIRGTLQGGVPLTFADVFSVLPLGITPDTTQAMPVGYPLMSAYLELADLKKVCAMQLVGQSNLVGSSFYLNLSGIKYSLNTTNAYTYFKYATAAMALEIAGNKMAAGSTAAAQAFLAVSNMGYDQGAALLAAQKAGNPYANAIVNLNDTTPDAAHVAANLAVVGQIAAAAIGGTNAVSALVVSKAVDAIDTVSAFDTADGENTGPATALTGSSRIRVAVDLYTLLFINAVKTQFGIAITPYQAATGTTALSSSDMTTLLGNRIDADPSTAGVQELKEWMALMSDIGTGLGGSITSDYASTANFAQFATFGSAVRTRNDAYPLTSIAQLVGTGAALQAAP